MTAGGGGSAPRVSVLMSVHNGWPWLAEAVTSVLAQTWEDFEFVIVDDGSTDATGEYLAGVRDPRVIVSRQARTGLAVALNRAVARSRGPLVARMDADDVAEAGRLARQVAFLDGHPEVGVLGTGWRELGPEGEVLEVAPPPRDDAAIRAALPRHNPIAHPTVMIRRQVGDAVGWYDPRVPVAQDWDLWIRLARVTRFANLPEPLLRRRFSRAMTSLALEDLRLETEVRLKWRAVCRRDLPLSALVHLLRPALARAVPRALRAARHRRRTDGVGLVFRAPR